MNKVLIFFYCPCFAIAYMLTLLFESNYKKIARFMIGLALHQNLNPNIVCRNEYLFGDNIIFECKR